METENPIETQIVDPETTEETTEDSTSKEETDYDALIEAEKKPDPEKAREAFKKRKEKETAEEPEESDEDKPMTRREMEEYLSRQTHRIFAEAHQERALEIANQLAESPKEAQFIMEIHRNRIFPEGMSIREQLQEAHAIATFKKMQAKNAELTRAVKSKETVSKETSSPRPEETKTAPKLAPDVARSLQQAGFTYDQSSKLYVKILPNKTKLYKDPKTGRTWQ